MSSQVVTIFAPRPVVAPRGAQWAASAALWIAGRILAAARAMRRQALEGPPETAPEVLAYAQRIERTMPGLAADLRAAAMRHEEKAGSTDAV